MADYAVAYRIKMSLGGGWDKNIRAVRVNGGRNLDLCVEKINSLDNAEVVEIRLFDPNSMSLPEWGKRPFDHDSCRTVYLYHYCDNSPLCLATEVTKAFMTREEAENELNRDFIRYCRKNFNEDPDANYRNYLERKGMTDISVNLDEISYVDNNINRKFLVIPLATEDYDPLLQS